MLELIPASAIIAIVVTALIVIFLAVGYVKAPPDMAFIISGIKKKSKIKNRNRKSSHPYSVF